MIVAYNEDELYHPHRIEGEWLQVKWGTDRNWQYAWIRWREGGKFLVELSYFA